jgi:quercetin dioxygenase-like cupin family protein
MAAGTSNPSQIIDVTEIAWESITPTIKAKMLWSDRASKRRAQLTRFEPGAFLSMHRHVGDELLYVVEGSITDESGTVAAGSAGYRPNGCVHSVTSKNGATVFAIITGGVEPAKEIGTAPPKAAGKSNYLIDESIKLRQPKHVGVGPDSNIKRGHAALSKSHHEAIRGPGAV